MSWLSGAPDSSFREVWSRTRVRNRAFPPLLAKDNDHLFHRLLRLTRLGDPDLWPWDRIWWKPKDRKSDLVRAGALALAGADPAARLVIAGWG